jgi:hypothetical protein
MHLPYVPSIFIWGTRDGKENGIITYRSVGIVMRDLVGLYESSKKRELIFCAAAGRRSFGRLKKRWSIIPKCRFRIFNLDLIGIYSFPEKG